MSLRDIVVFLDALPASEERLRPATHVARNHRAHLGVVFVHDDQAVAEASGIVAGYGLISKLMPDVSSTRRNAGFAGGCEQQMRERLRWFGGDSSWHDVDEGGSARLIAFARPPTWSFLASTAAKFGQDRRGGQMRSLSTVDVPSWWSLMSGRLPSLAAACLLPGMDPGKRRVRSTTHCR